MRTVRMTARAIALAIATCFLVPTGTMAESPVGKVLQFRNVLVCDHAHEVRQVLTALTQKGIDAAGAVIAKLLMERSDVSDEETKCGIMNLVALAVAIVDQRDVATPLGVRTFYLLKVRNRGRDYHVFFGVPKTAPPSAGEEIQL